MLKCPHVPKQGRPGWTHAAHPVLSARLPRRMGAHPSLLAALKGWQGDHRENTRQGEPMLPNRRGRCWRTPSIIK